jgi:hypothetical protein
MKELKFAHITRTSGTSIETCAKKQMNLAWGRFHKEYGIHWHQPLIEIEQLVQSKYDWFTVVRNPYDRIISEFYFFGIPPYNKTVSKKDFNKIIRQNILSQHKKEYHYYEQYKYISNISTTHILRYENIDIDFNNLMSQYGLNIKLNIKQKISNTKILNIVDLDNVTIELINNFYQKDFELLNYEMK